LKLQKWETAGAVLEICLFSALLWRLLGVFLEELCLFIGIKTVTEEGGALEKFVQKLASR
jgi:hypothetical protein